MAQPAQLHDLKLDVPRAVQAGAAVLTASPFDLGDINSIFDGKTNSLARTPDVNPAFVQVAYTQARAFTGFRVLLSYGTRYEWWIEKADTQTDMDSHSGSWALLGTTHSVLSGKWDQQSQPPVTAKIVRLNLRRFGGDGYCHINEWELHADVPIDRLDVIPASVSAFHGETRQFHASAFNTGLNEYFDADAPARWSLLGDVGSITTTGLFTAAGPGQGTVTASVGSLVSAPARVLVQQSEADIDVLYIERTPRLAFNPGDANYTSGLPRAGQAVTYLAHVKNWGTDPVDLPFEWRFDDAIGGSGHVVIGAGLEITIPFVWHWEAADHDLEFRADPESILFEISRLNNRVKIRTHALLVGLWVEQSLYHHFHQGQILLNDGANGFEDWGQRMVARWNYLFAKTRFPFAPDGFLDRMALDKVVVVPDKALPLAGGLAGNNPDTRDRTVDVQWGYPWTPADTNNGAFYGFRWNGPFYIDFGSIHEMNHARYHVDLYALDENHNPTHPNVPLKDDDTGRGVVGTPKMPFIAFDVVYYNKWRDIMGAGPPVFDGYSAGAWNWKTHRRGEGNENSPPDLGRFLDDLPLTNHVRFIDQRGVPLAGAAVSLYRTPGGFYTKVFSPDPATNLVTDSNGFIHLGRNPFGASPNFGNSSPDVIFKVRHHGQSYFMFQEVTDFNIQNWLHAGLRKQAKEGFYVREIDLRDLPDRVPNDGWLGNYFNGLGFQDFVTNRLEGTGNGLDFSWAGAPAGGVSPESFSVYWQGGIQFTEGWKTFKLATDGGLQVLIDSRLVFDQWTNSTPQSWMPVIYTSASAPFVNPGRSAAYGRFHRMEVRYRHHAGPAHLQLSWADEPPPTAVPVNAWRADYHGTRDLSGYLLSRQETVINNNYRDGSPDPVVGADNFSVRWTGDWDFPGGNVTFTAIPDDGMRVFIDEVLVLNKWFAQPPTTYKVTRNLTQGRHRLRVEYFEGAATAQAIFTWNLAPWITSLPADQTVLEGADVSFHAGASGMPSPRYQWLRAKNPVPGGNAAVLTLGNLQPADSGDYTLVVTNTAGSVSATAHLTVIPRGAVPVISRPSLGADGLFGFQISGAAAWKYQVQGTTNLMDWLFLTNLDLGTGPVWFTDLMSTNLSHRFYRGVVIPPPGRN